MNVALVGRLTATLGVLTVACVAAATAPAPLPRGQALADLQQAVYQADIGPQSWRVATITAAPGANALTVGVIGDLDDARRTLDQRWPGQTRVVHGQTVVPAIWEPGHDYTLEVELRGLERPDFRVFETGATEDGRTTVGVVGDLAAARTYLDSHYPGHTIVHGNTAP
ncbi:hypothetical protein [Kitasatospora sp. NPDC088548]|uniref:hypothetical protein n=1 Tax=Kitasatospora sp. NPDC088548 TaxID=3364075 RepID=UPI00382BB645